MPAVPGLEGYMHKDQEFMVIFSSLEVSLGYMKLNLRK